MWAKVVFIASQDKELADYFYFLPVSSDIFCTFAPEKFYMVVFCSI
jgi:hypothetical protein